MGTLLSLIAAITASGFLKGGVGPLPALLSIFVVTFLSSSAGTLAMINLYNPLPVSRDTHPELAGLRRIYVTPVERNFFSVSCPLCGTKIGISRLRLGASIRHLCSRCRAVLVYDGNPMALAVFSIVPATIISVIVGCGAAFMNDYRLPLDGALVAVGTYIALILIFMQYTVVHRYDVSSVWSDPTRAQKPITVQAPPQ